MSTQFFIHFTDQVNNRIRKINLNGEVSTVAGNGVIGYSGDGLPATSALINNPGKVEISSTNEIYFAVSDLLYLSILT